MPAMVAVATMAVLFWENDPPESAEVSMEESVEFVVAAGTVVV